MGIIPISRQLPSAGSRYFFRGVGLQFANFTPIFWRFCLAPRTRARPSLAPVPRARLLLVAPSHLCTSPTPRTRATLSRQQTTTNDYKYICLDSFRSCLIHAPKFIYINFLR